MMVGRELTFQLDHFSGGRSGQSTQSVGTDGHSDDLSCSIIGFTITAKTHLYIQIVPIGTRFSPSLQAFFFVRSGEDPSRVAEDAALVVVVM